VYHLETIEAAIGELTAERPQSGAKRLPTWRRPKFRKGPKAEIHSISADDFEQVTDKKISHLRRP